MDETMNNFSWWNSTSSTSDGNTVWITMNGELEWIPYKIKKYKPKWHINQGYKNQIKKMWD